MKRSLIFILCIVLGLPASATREMPQEEAPAITIPFPDLSSMEETAQEKIKSMQTALAELVKRPDVSPSEISESIGHLGQLFHAYRLLESAEESYLISRKLAPDDPRWSYYLGLVRHAEGDLDTAVADYEQALKLNPDDTVVLLRLGTVLLELNRVEEARQRYSRVRELDPQNAAALYGLGKTAGFSDDYEQAVQLFEQTLALQPEASVVHYLLGQAYRKLGDLEKAQSHLQQRGQDDVSFADPLGEQISRLAMGTAFEIVLALAKSADDFSDDEFLGFALSHFGDVRGSIEQLQKGLSLKQQEDSSSLEQARIHYVLGGLLVNDNRDPEAIEQFQQALALAPDLVDARIKLGNALARGKRFDDALVAYDAVVARRPDDPAVLIKRVATLTTLEQDERAKADLEHLLKLAPEVSEVHVRLAGLLEKAEDFEGALARYQAAAKLDLTPTERPQVHFRIASLHRQQDRLQEAVNEYQNALKANPQFAPALSGFASLLGQVGRPADAAVLYGELVRIQPDNPDALVAEASFLIFSEQHTAARQKLELGVASFPDDLRFQDILARHLAAAPDRSVRDGARALEMAQSLYDRVPTPESIETLAMAFAQAGRFEDAVKWQKELLGGLAPERPDELEARLRGNLALYESGQSCCVEPGS